VSTFLLVFAALAVGAILGGLVVILYVVASFWDMMK
jgi:hypothetical protein